MISKKCPYKEKYTRATDFLNLVQTWTQQLVKKNLGDKREAEQAPLAETDKGHSSRCVGQGKIRNTWLHIWQGTYDLVKTDLGESTDDKFIIAGAQALKQSSKGLSLYVYKFMRAIATAFHIFAKQMAYQWQVFTPSTVSELSSERMTLSIQECKFLSVEGCEAPCIIGCQKAGPKWMEDPFNLKLTLDRQGRNCTVTLSQK